MTKQDSTMSGTEVDWLIIIEALEMLQADSLDQLRADDYDDLSETDREYKERLPATIARVLRKVSKAYG